MITKTLLALLLIQDPKTPPDPRDQQISWLQKKISLLEEKMKALAAYYTADEQLIQLEQQKPAPKTAEKDKPTQ